MATKSGRVTHRLSAPSSTSHFDGSNFRRFMNALARPTTTANRLVLEVAQHLGDKHRAHHRHGHHRRNGPRSGGRPTPAMPISVPVGPETLGRIMNVIGEPVDEARPGQDQGPLPASTSPAPSFVDQSDGSRDPGHRHQGHRPASSPLCPSGGKIGLFGGAGVGKTVVIHGTDQQRRQGPWRLLGVRRRRRAHPRGQRPLSRNDRVRREQGPQGEQRLDRRLQVRPGVRPDERTAREPVPASACPA